MLTDADRLLIAAAADGPLSTDEAGRLARLLAASPDARALADRLADDRRVLRELALFAAPAGFADEVLHRLPVIVTARPVEKPRRANWLPVASAAAVLAGVGVLTFQLNRPRPQPSAVAKAAPSRATVPPPAQTAVAPAPRPAPEAPPAVVSLTPVPTELAPPPREAVAPELYAAGLFTGIEPPTEVITRLPLLGPLADLSTPAGRSQATANWAGLPAARLDVFTADLGSAVSALQDAARGCGWSVSIDPSTPALLKSKQPGSVALYLDAVPPSDGVGFLIALNKTGAKLGSVHLSAFGPTDIKEVRELLGEPKKPIRDPKDPSTIGQVVRQLTPKHPALLFAHSPPAARPGQASREVRAFADGRGERPTGAVPLLIVIRPHEAN